MVQSLSIYEAQAIMREDQLQFDRAIGRLRGTDGISFVDATQLRRLHKKSGCSRAPMAFKQKNISR
jgi:hypothetical protein